MSIRRVFLGWDRPCLDAAVEVLCGAPYLSHTSWDLSSVVMVVPGGRARRRLWELLALRAATCKASGSEAPVVLTPPTIITQGQLFEEILPLSDVASDLQSLLARTAALRMADTAVLQRVFASPPSREDVSAWVTLAEDVGRLHSELAGEGLTFADVAQRCRRLPADYCDAERWEALAELHVAYQERLRAEGLVDRYDARRAALANLPASSMPVARTIYLVGTVDLNRVTRDLLQQSPQDVVALIYAPESEAAGFDAFGCVNVEWWRQAEIPLPETSLRVVDRPRDQAYAVLDVLESLGGRYSADQITVGVGDPALEPLITRTLELAGLPARSAVGTPVERSHPARVLAALMEYVADPRVDRFAALLRCPDVEEWLVRGCAEALGPVAAQREQWLPWLDQYASEHLPLRLGQAWPTQPRTADAAAALRVLYEHVEALAVRLRGRARPLPEWSPVIAGVLADIYGWRDLDRHGDDELVRALEAFTRRLREQYTLPTGSPLAPEMSGPEALAFTLRRLTGEGIPDTDGRPAIELLGWLELYLDDAPVLVLTGLNEGHVPESVNGDAFLPDRLRRELGLLDNSRRYARDALVLRALVAGRESLTVISGRRSAAGDPLVPSRLLFACDARTLVRRSLEFYGEAGSAVPARLLVRPGERNRFLIPLPGALRQPVTRLSVTAFRDYLRCPYRFYLRHVLRTEARNDQAVELDGSLFGQLLHDVVAGFGASPIRDSERPAEIVDYLRTKLEQLVEDRFGSERAPAVELQLFQLQRRLVQFAEWQAEHARQGWRIQAVERELQTQLPLDAGDSFLIHGRVDRIDRHEETGRYLIVDCKTGDKARDPDQAHRAKRNGEQQWTDLQLPLYRRLATALNVDGTPVEAAQVDVGYLCLPKKLSDVKLLTAAWSEADFQDAEAAARAVIRAVRAERFWPPSEEPTRYLDDYSSICLDECIERSQIIADSGRLWA